MATQYISIDELARICQVGSETVKQWIRAAQDGHTDMVPEMNRDNPLGAC